MYVFFLSHMHPVEQREMLIIFIWESDVCDWIFN